MWVHIFKGPPSFPSRARVSSQLFYAPLLQGRQTAALHLFPVLEWAQPCGAHTLKGPLLPLRPAHLGEMIVFLSIQ